MARLIAEERMEAESSGWLTRLSSLEDFMGDVQEQLPDLQGRVSRLEEAHAAFQQNVGTLQQNVSTMGSATTDLVQAVGNWAGNFQILRLKLHDAKEAMARLHRTVQEGLREMREFRLESDARWERIRIEHRLSDVERRVTRLEGEGPPAA